MAERTIFLKKRPLRKEGIAAGAITPGQTVVLGSGGTYAAGPAAAAAPSDNTLSVAFEQELKNGATVDTPYAANDRLYFGTPSSGAEWYALVAPSAAAIVKGDKLEYNGGYLRKATTGVVKAIALEAVDNSANAVTPARIIVEAV